MRLKVLELGGTDLPLPLIAQLIEDGCGSFGVRDKATLSDWLLWCGGVEPLVLAGQVVAPVVVEVAVADDGAQGEDGLGALESPACSGDVEAVADQAAAGAFDDPVAMGQPAAGAWS